MPGIIDFMTDVGDDSALAKAFVSKISQKCTQQELLDFFIQNSYADVTPADVDKLLSQKERVKSDFNLPDNVDY